MAYTAGTANSMEDLRVALVTFCLANGWTGSESNTVLNKGPVHVRPSIVGTAGIGDPNGLKLHMGDSSTFVDPGYTIASQFPYVRNYTAVWPVSYRIFVLNDGAAETVWIQFLEADGLRYEHLGFGFLQNKNGSWVGGEWVAGSWASGSTFFPAPYTNAGNDPGIQNLSGDSGGVHGEVYGGEQGPPFMTRVDHPNFGGNFMNSTSYLRCNLDSATVLGNFRHGYSGQSMDAMRWARLKLMRQPNLWNGESCLVPINLYMYRDSQTASRLGTILGIRWMRMDNYEPGDIITLGSDKWMILPIAKRDITDPNGASSFNLFSNHTGQIAYAIKYDGP